MVTIKRKAKGTSHNPLLDEVLDEAKKEQVIPLHVQLPQSLMKKLRVYAAENEKSLRDVTIEALEKTLEK
jgi:hypothetical protein